MLGKLVGEPPGQPVKDDPSLLPEGDQACRPKQLVGVGRGESPTDDD